MGCPPTDLNARTGELTPPGIKSRAAEKISSDLVVFNGAVLTKIPFPLRYQYQDEGDRAHPLSVFEVLIIILLIAWTG
ncbi:MAG: hypothetical protein ACFBSF_15600 [Leptolyngbyaceae cyanobacterium]